MENFFKPKWFKLLLTPFHAKWKSGKDKKTGSFFWVKVEGTELINKTHVGGRTNLNIVEGVELIIEIQIRRKLILSLASSAPSSRMRWIEFRTLTETTANRLTDSTIFLVLTFYQTCRDKEAKRKPKIIRRFKRDRKSKIIRCFEWDRGSLR